MNDQSNKLRNFPTHLITGALFATVISLIFLLHTQQKQKDRQRIEYINALSYNTDSLQHQLELTRMERDSLLHSFDSLDSFNQALSADVEQLRIENKKIKGRYNNVSTDSLGKMMNRRAGQTP